MAGGLLLGTTELTAVERPLRLPDRFLPAFADGGVVTAWLDGCLALWPQATWSTLAGRVVSLPMSAQGGGRFGGDRAGRNRLVEFVLTIHAHSSHCCAAG